MWPFDEKFHVMCSINQIYGDNHIEHAMCLILQLYCMHNVCISLYALCIFYALGRKYEHTIWSIGTSFQNFKNMNDNDLK